MGVSIVVTSGKGGVGKTTAVANVGAALAMLEKRVVLLDADVGLRNLDLMMDVEDAVVYDIIDAAQDICPLEQALIRDVRFPQLYILPAAQTLPRSDLTAEQMRKIVEQLKELFDFVLIDSPAGIDAGFRRAVAAVDYAIVVTNPDIAALRDADRVVGLLMNEGMTDTRLIVNRLATVEKGSGLLTLEQMVDLLGVTLLGVVPEDDTMSEVLLHHELSVMREKAPAGKAYRNIAGRLTGATVPLMPLP